MVWKPEPSAMLDKLPPVEFLSALKEEDLTSLAAVAQLQRYALGDEIAVAGTEAQGLYIVRSGRVRVFLTTSGKERSIGISKAGDVLCELAALRRYVHEFSLRASGDTELIFIPAAAFRAILDARPQAEEFMASYAAIRATGGVVSQLFDLGDKVSRDTVRELVGTVGIKSVAAGEVLVSQDSLDDRRLYVVRQGVVKLVREEGTRSFELARLEQGEIFGEKACLLRQPHLVSAVASTRVVLLIVPEETVRVILQQNRRLREVFEERMQFLERELARQQKLEEVRSTPLFKLDLQTRERPGERVLKRFPLVQQAEEMDCGAASLAMICRYHGITTTVGKLRDLINVSQDGATLESIARVAESLGFTTRGVQATLGALKTLEFPLIAHWEGYHFIVVYGISDEHVWVADPGPGFRKLPIDVFEKGWTGTCLLFSPEAIDTQAVKGRSPWLRFADYLRPHKRTIGHMFLAALVIQILNLAPPVITQNVFDRVIVHANADLLVYLIVGLLMAQGFSQVTTLLRGYLANFMTRSMDFAMMSSFFRHTLALPIAFFANRRTGDIVARFQENQTIRAFLTGQTVGTVLNVLMVFVYLSVMFLYNVKLTLLLLALIVPLFLLTLAITPRMKDYGRRTFEASTDAEAVLMETVNAAEPIKGMGIERQARLKWEKKYAHALNVQYSAQGFHLLVGVGSQALNIVATATVLYVGATMVIAQEMSVGQLIAFNMLSSSVMTPLLGLVSLWDELHAAGVAMERLADVLDIEPEQRSEDLQSRVVLPELKGDIRFENVYFRYGDEASPYVLKDVSLRIRPGEMVAVVGQSGSGKSTLAKLLMGFYQPTEGRIVVDGYDLELLELNRYRAQIGYVMQTNLLFQGTIAENIAIGDEEPDRRRIVEAARLADAHDFVSNLPLGYENRVGERGVGLSGGQIQRICIARTLYRSPGLLVFDEATSALDTESESNILSRMEGILEGRTALVIAHRMSTILRADRIIVLYNGAITESGTHQELLARRGMYHQLVQKQMGAAA
ncbi:MAG: peptidase domain-containing ABC transporter [Pseudomonadales bacterium]|nr:peptidase domain-containing ABC transporter [Pseudomonadales bacterium]MCP5183276.1 peptidase domain-containing ABC transporter [Pseudomonadales bacterium]